MYGLSVHDMVGRIDNFVDDSKGNDNNKKNQPNKRKNNVETEEAEEDEEVAAVHIKQTNESNQNEDTTDNDKPTSSESTTQETGGYDAIMASIITGNNVVDDIGGVDINDIPLDDESLGKFACTVIIKPKQDIHESDKTPQF